jgi:hypothetical protein
MKNLTRFLGIAVLVAVIGFTMITCSDGGGGGGGSRRGNDQPLTNPDQNPDLTVPASPSGIPNFNSSKGYSAFSSKSEAEDLVAEFEELLDEFVAELNETLDSDGFGGLFSINYNYSRASFGRAVFGRAAESIDINLSELLKEEFGDMPYVKFNGYIKGTVSYPDNDEDIFPLSANGSAKFRLETSEGFDADGELEGYETIGFVTGEVNVNNIRITSEDSMSGSANATVNYAVNLADKESSQWIKLLGKVTVAVNLGNQTATVTVTLSAYGDGTDPLVTKTITASATSSRVTVTSR